MTHFFEKRDPWGHGLGLWVVVGMVFLAPLAWWSISQIHLHNDVENWLPKEDEQAQVLAWYREHFDRRERILVSWRGSDLADPRLKALERALEGFDAEGKRTRGPHYVEQAILPQEIIARMTEQGLDEREAIERMQGVLLGPGMLRVRLSDLAREKKNEAALLIESEARGQLGIDLKVISIASAPSEDEDGASRAYDLEIACPALHDDPAQREKVEALLHVLRFEEG